MLSKYEKKYNFSPDGIRAKLSSLVFLVFSTFITDFVAFIASFFKNLEKFGFMAELLLYFLIVACIAAILP